MANRPENTIGFVFFNHGRDSSPWTTKIKRLAKTAQAKGFAIESLDYTGILDPDRRVQILLDSVNAEIRPLILVGSSMGGYVSTVASELLKPQGLFLLAPALYMEDYAVQDPRPCAEIISIVHGWNDEIIPVDHSIRFARKHHAHLHLVDDDHRLMNQLSTIVWLFNWFLDQFNSMSGRNKY
jgi:surfactin synthase thioesterase subunit